MSLINNISIFYVLVRKLKQNKKSKITISEISSKFSQCPDPERAPNGTFSLLKVLISTFRSLKMLFQHLLPQ